MKNLEASRPLASSLCGMLCCYECGTWHVAVQAQSFVVQHRFCFRSVAPEAHHGFGQNPIPPNCNESDESQEGVAEDESDESKKGNEIHEASAEGKKLESGNFLSFVFWWHIFVLQQ